MPEGWSLFALHRQLLLLILAPCGRFSIDIDQYPTIARVNKALSELPEFQAACPSKQPDCPEDLREEAAHKA